MTAPPPNLDPLAALFRRYRASGDADAFAELYDRTAPLLACFAARLAPHPRDVEDLLQATYLDAIRSRAGFADDRPLMPWLFGILARCARNATRRQRPALAPDLEPVGRAAPADEAIRVETLAALESAIGSLAQPYADVVRAHLLGQRSPAEIAATLNRSPSTVRTWLARGLSRLREVLPAGLAPALALLLDEQAWAAQRTQVLTAATGQAPATQASTPRVDAHRPGTVRRWSVAAVAIILLSGLVWWGTRPATPTTADDVATAERGADTTTAADPAAHAAPSRQPAAPATAADAIAPEPALCRVHVIAAATGAGIPDVPVFAAPLGEGTLSVLDLIDRRRIAHAQTDANGHATLTLERPGKVRIGVGDQRFVHAAIAGANEATVVRVDRVLDLRGRVVDHTGAPFGPADLYASSYHAVLPGTAIGRTDEDGRFAVRLVVGSPLAVWAVAESACARTITHVRQTSGVAEIELPLNAPTRRVEGRITDATGHPIEGARVCMMALTERLDPPWCEVRSDAAGRFVAAGVSRDELLLIARVPGRAPVARRIEPNTERADLVVDGAARLSGRITHPLVAGGGLEVTVMPYLAGPARRGRERLRAVPVPLAADGSYRLDGLSTGTVVASVLSLLDVAVFAERLELVSGEEHRWSPTEDPSRSVTGRLLAPDGAPRPHFSLLLYGTPPQSRLLCTDAEGRFHCGGLPKDDYRLVASGPATRPLSPPWGERRAHAGDAPFDWHLAEPSAGLRARLVDATGDPVAGAGLALGLVEGDLYPYVSFADADGNVRTPPVAPGQPHRLSVVGPRGAWHPVDTVELAAGEARDLGELVVPRPGDLAVTLSLPDGAGPPTAAEVRVRADRHAIRLQRTGDALRPVRPVPPGAHTICIAGPGFAPVAQAIVVDRDRPTHLSFQPHPAPTVALTARIDFTACEDLTGRFMVRVRDGAGTVVLRLEQLALAAQEKLDFGLPPGRYAVTASTTWGATGVGSLLVPDGATPSQILPLTIAVR
ncbi:MAG: sigma-70 family RNA polymerase sigma factor [Planctomycetota bacterium]